MPKPWNSLPKAPLDPIMIANSEWPEFERSYANAVNTTIGVLVDPASGKIWRPTSITRSLEVALQRINEQSLHSYQNQNGNQVYLQAMSKILFGETVSDIISYQTLGGTGALALARETLVALLQKKDSRLPLVLDPGWPNHPAIFADPFSISTYKHLDASGAYDHQAALDAIADAPQNPIILLQVCGYNDDGADRTKQQWDEIFNAAAAKKAVVILDSAYLGLANGIELDCYPITCSVKKGLLTLVCVSSSKNMGLYNERVGALMIANASQNLGDIQARNLGQAISKIVRRTVSSTPALAAMAAGRALSDDGYYEELEIIRRELSANRQAFANIVGDLAPNIASGKGLFTKLLPEGFSGSQMAFLRREGVLALPNSRINLGGLRSDQIYQVATVMSKALQQT